MTNPKKNRKVFNIILAIVLAVGVWLYVINVENPTGTVPIRDIPVSLVGEDSLAERGLMVTDQSRDSVNLKLSGRRKTLMKLNRKNLTLELDVSTITSEGEHTISCRASFPNNIGTDNVSVSDWEDLRVTVTVEKQETKEIPVRGEFIGTEAENCLAGAVSTDPETITLTGPAEALDGVSYALATIGGKEVSDTITETASVVLMGPGSKPASRKNITLDQETVDVTVPVRQVVALPLTVTLTGGDTTSAADVTVDISPKNLTVVKEAGADLPESISLGEIDLSNVLADTSYALPIHLPDGVVAWGQEARFATVSLSFDKVKARQLETKQITFTNVPEGWKASLVNATLSVWVRGDPEQVEHLSADQIQVTVDLSKAAAEDELQRAAAKVSLKEGAGEKVSILGNHYSVAFYLSKS